MADEITAPGPVFSLQKLYFKNVSFEAPGAPDVFRSKDLREQPTQVQLNLQQSIKELEAGMFDVNLSVTVTCKAGETTLYLAEIEQCGVFVAQGFDASQLKQVLNIHCPNLLFPYARTELSNLVVVGGFPPLLLQPLDFAQLFAEQQRQLAEQAPAGNA